MIKLKKKLAIFFGTRPEYLKIKPILNNIHRNSYILIYVTQHNHLKEDFEFDEIIKIKKLKKIDRLHEISSSVLSNNNLNINCKYVMIQGDTQTAMTIALSSFFNKKTVFHLEAGLRSFDNSSPFPEEVNRKIISLLSNYHFCPTQLSKKNLRNENIKKNIYITGNTALDNLKHLKNKIEYKNLVVITLHRRENFEIYEKWLKHLNNLAHHYNTIRFYFVLHPNPVYQKYLEKFNNLIFLKHMSHKHLMEYVTISKLLITDSGGLQEEGSFLKKKIIVCRKETERPEGINTGHLFLCKKPNNLDSIFKKLINNYKINIKSPYGDGNSGKKISTLLKKICK